MDFGTYVERGAQFLDKEMPGWEERVDLSSLSLRDPCKCVVGHLYGNYCAVIGGLIQDGEPSEYGFDINYWATDKDWNALTEEWRVLIQSRRNVKELEKDLALQTPISI